MAIQISFNDAVERLVEKTYLDTENARQLMRLMYYTEKFRQTTGRLPQGQDHLKMSEYAATDKAVFFYSLHFDAKYIDKLAENVNKTNPFKETSSL